MEPNYFDIAVVGARTLAQPSEFTHWSYWDEPQAALCGERIVSGRQFSTDPTCPLCRATLAQINAQEMPF
jgi:hypothetical protein